MYLRRALLSFVILFGVTLLVSPSSVYAAFDFCVPNPDASSTSCPPGSTFKSVCSLPSGGDCLSVTGGMYEHCCTSAVDPCALDDAGGAVCSTSACSGPTFKINSCASVCSDTFCISNTALTAGGGTPTACSGTCLSVCGGTTPTPEVTGNAACATADPLKPLCCKAAVVIPASTPTGSDVTTVVKNPLSFGSVEGVLGSILSTLRAIIVVFALIFIVIGGILYITSAGNDERMKTAKGAITSALIGLALGVAAPSFLRQIGDILGWGVPAGPAATAKTLSAIALSALQFLLSVVGILGIIMLVVGGLTYITSAGNEERSQSGKKIVTYAIIGIAIALASLVVVTQIAGLFVP